MGDGVFNASPVYLEFAQPDQTCYNTIKSELTRFFSINSSRISSFTLWCVDRSSSDKITDCEIVYEVSSENWIWFSRKPGIYIHRLKCEAEAVEVCTGRRRRGCGRKQKEERGKVPPLLVEFECVKEFLGKYLARRRRRHILKKSI